MIARDLPGHGRDPTQLSEITFEYLVDSVCAIRDEQAEPMILVGHSWGGGIITQAAEHRPDRIDAMVYLTGLLPKSGQSMMDCLTLPEAEESLARRALEPSADQSYLSLRLELIREVDCADCSDEDWALLERLMQPIPTAPFLPPTATTDANFGRLPKVYIECLQDRALPLAAQRRLQRETRIDTVLSLDTSHCPNFSAPDELAAALVRAATIS